MLWTRGGYACLRQSSGCQGWRSDLFPGVCTPGSTLPADTVRSSSGRDSDNNIIVYWDANYGELPSDNATCWLYVSRLNSWDQLY